MKHDSQLDVLLALWLAGPNMMLGEISPCIALWAHVTDADSDRFFKNTDSLLHSPNRSQMPTIMVVQWDCEGV